MSDLPLDEILKIAVKEEASDVHLKAGLPPIIRLHGALLNLKQYEKITPEQISDMATAIMNKEQKAEFDVKHQVDMAYSLPGVARFRVNIFQQRGTLGAAFRVIPSRIESFDNLHLPPVMEKLSSEVRGLIIVTGITGSGKSTTLASLVDHINNHRSSHVITVEDPIEYVHKDKMSIINQRELGVDTLSFADALRAALRQDPDVIMVGEMRDMETIEIALTAAETGHLVLSTLHTIDATETISRIVSVFPPYQQKQIRIQLASVVKGIVSQRLLPTKDGKSRVPAVEIMVTNARIRSCIEDKEKTREISDAIYKGQTTFQMQTFDQSIMSLLEQGLITYEEAVRQASNPDDFVLQVKGVTSTTDRGWKDFRKKDDEGGSYGGGGDDDDGIERF